MTYGTDAPSDTPEFFCPSCGRTSIVQTTCDPCNLPMVRPGKALRFKSARVSLPPLGLSIPIGGSIAAASAIFMGLFVMLVLSGRGATFLSALYIVLLSASFALVAFVWTARRIESAFGPWLDVRLRRLRHRKALHATRIGEPTRYEGVARIRDGRLYVLSATGKVRIELEGLEGINQSGDHLGHICDGEEVEVLGICAYGEAETKGYRSSDRRRAIGAGATLIVKR